MEETQVAGGNTQDASGVQENETKKAYEAAKHDGIAYDTYRKAVSQYKKASEKIAELETQLSAVAQEKMQAEGKKDELINALRKQTQELEAKYKQSQASYTWNVVGAQIKAELAARGVSNPEKALHYAKAVHRDDLATIQVGEDYTVERNDLQRFVDKFLNENQDMGFVSRVKVKDLPPGKVEMTKQTQLTTSADKVKFMKDQLAQVLNKG